MDDGSIDVTSPPSAICISGAVAGCAAKGSAKSSATPGSYGAVTEIYGEGLRRAFVLVVALITLFPQERLSSAAKILLDASSVPLMAILPGAALQSGKMLLEPVAEAGPDLRHPGLSDVVAAAKPQEMHFAALEQPELLANDVREFFRIYYAPNNAVLSVVGDFDTGEARSLVEKYFANIPAQPDPRLHRRRRRRRRE